MKKLLLLFVAFVVATTAFAQTEKTIKRKVLHGTQIASCKTRSHR